MLHTTRARVSSDVREWRPFCQVAVFLCLSFMIQQDFFTLSVHSFWLYTLFLIFKLSRNCIFLFPKQSSKRSWTDSWLFLEHMLISESNTMGTIGVFCLVRLGAPACSQSWGEEEGQMTLGNWGTGCSSMEKQGAIARRREKGYSVQFSHSVMSDSLWPHESQNARPPCPSPTPGVHSDSRPSSQWCPPAISSSVVPFSSCSRSLPASESFPMSQLFAWGGQGTGVSALASFLPKKSQGWSPSEWTGWISLLSKGLSRVFSNTTVQKHQFFSAQLSSQSNSHIHTWPLEKP